MIVKSLLKDEIYPEHSYLNIVGKDIGMFAFRFKLKEQA